MASPTLSMEAVVVRPQETNGDAHLIRVIVADSQAIFRAGLRKGRGQTLPESACGTGDQDTLARKV